MPVAELRPLSIGELLDKTFSLYRSHFLLFVGIMAVPGIIPLALGILFEMIRFDLVGSFIIFLAHTVVYAMALAATVSAVSEVYLGHNTTILGAYAKVRGRALRTLWMLAVLGLAIGVGFLLFIVPGVLVAIWYAVAIPAAIVENLKTGAAFRRSESLTKGRRGSIFLVFVLFFVLNYGALALFDFPAALLYDVWPSVTSYVIQKLATFVSGALVGPLLTVGLSLMYYDLRVRKEGFDLQLMLSSLDSAPPAVSPL
jgi:hypothetical protein